MSISEQKIECIIPSMGRLPGVRAWFTLKNRDYKNPGKAGIAGLNLGSNTRDVKGRVYENRHSLFQFLGLDEQWVALADQVHGTRVQTVSSGGVYAQTDGLVTNIPGLALGIQVADCAAVLLYDPQNRVIAAAHAGWRGAAGDILPGTIEAMKRLEGDPSEMHAFISPCISSSHFEVGYEVAEQFPGRFVDYESYKKPHVDLKGFLEHQLKESGLASQRIQVDRRCTYKEAGELYSFRREGEQSGRMMALLAMD